MDVSNYVPSRIISAPASPNIAAQRSDVCPDCYHCHHHSSPLLHQFYHQHYCSGCNEAMYHQSRPSYIKPYSPFQNPRRYQKTQTVPKYQPKFGPNVNSLTVPSILEGQGNFQGPPQTRPLRPTLQRQVSVDLTNTILEETSSSDEDDKSSAKSFLTVRRSSSRRIRRTQSDSSAIESKTDTDPEVQNNEVSKSPTKTIIGRSMRVTCL